VEQHVLRVRRELLGLLGLLERQESMVPRA